MDVPSKSCSSFISELQISCCWGRKVLHDIAKALDPDAKLMKRNLGSDCAAHADAGRRPLSNVPERDV